MFVIFLHQYCEVIWTIQDVIYLLKSEHDQKAVWVLYKSAFLGPQGPLRTPLSVHLQEKSELPQKPYKSSQDHVRPPL